MTVLCVQHRVLDVHLDISPRRSCKVSGSVALSICLGTTAKPSSCVRISSSVASKYSLNVKTARIIVKRDGKRLKYKESQTWGRLVSARLRCLCRGKSLWRCLEARLLARPTRWRGTSHRAPLLSLISPYLLQKETTVSGNTEGNEGCEGKEKDARETKTDSERRRV